MTGQARPPESASPAGSVTSAGPAGLVGSVSPASPEARRWLDLAAVERPVLDLRPDYTALIIVADGLHPGPSDEATDALLSDAEAQAHIRDRRFGGTPLGWARYFGQEPLIELLEPLTAPDDTETGAGEPAP